MARRARRGAGGAHDPRTEQARPMAICNALERRRAARTDGWQLVNKVPSGRQQGATARGPSSRGGGAPHPWLEIGRKLARRAELRMASFNKLAPLCSAPSLFLPKGSSFAPGCPLARSLARCLPETPSGAPAGSCGAPSGSLVCRAAARWRHCLASLNALEELPNVKRCRPEDNLPPLTGHELAAGLPAAGKAPSKTLTRVNR